MVLRAFYEFKSAYMLMIISMKYYFVLGLPINIDQIYPIFLDREGEVNILFI